MAEAARPWHLVASLGPEQECWAVHVGLEGGQRGGLGHLDEMLTLLCSLCLLEPKVLKGDHHGTLRGSASLV